MLKRRQFISGALLGTVAVSAYSSGGGDGGGDDSGGVTTFSYLRPTWGPATYTKNGAYERTLDKKAGVDVKVQIIPVIDYDTKVNTILASGDIPDVIWGSGPVSGTWKEAQDEGAFLPIDDYLDKYPAIRKAVPDSIWKTLKDTHGDTYFIPNLIWPQVPFFLFYRQDLFEQANLAEPKTLQEFVTTLTTLKSKFPKLVPFTMGYRSGTPRSWPTSFGVAKNGWEPAPDNGRPAHTVVHEGQGDRPLLLGFQDLHRKGLLDPDYGVDRGRTSPPTSSRPARR